MRKLARWSKASLPSMSMGQEISVTTLQLAQAAAVVANGGLLVKPRLVLKKGNQTVPAEPPVRVLKPGDGHHHAADDGRRGDARRHGDQGQAGRLYQRREDRFGADLRSGGQALHAFVQRFVHGLRAADQPGHGGSGDAEWDPRYGGLRRARRRRRCFMRW